MISTSYRARIIISVLGGLSIAVWQLVVGIREHDVPRLVGVVVAVALGVLIPAFIWYVRALPRRELRKRIARDGGGSVFEGKVDAFALAQLGQPDVTGVTDVVLAVDELGLHIHLAASAGGEIMLSFPEILDVAVSGDDDPSTGGGTVLFALSREPRDLSITLYASFMWGAFPATPAATRRFVEVLRGHVAEGAG